MLSQLCSRPLFIATLSVVPCLYYIPFNVLLQFLFVTVGMLSHRELSLIRRVHMLSRFRYFENAGLSLSYHDQPQGTT